MVPPRIGVVGAGGWGRNHLRVLNQLGALGAICDADPEVGTPAWCERWRAQYDVPLYRDVESLLRQEQLEAVIVATPTRTHAAIATQTLNAGLPTFVEKPLTADSREAAGLVELAETRKVLLTTGFIERFNPGVERLRQYLQNGRLGELLLLEFHRENVWSANIGDVGIVADTSSHDIDLSRWLFGAEPRVVYARCGRVRSSREDFAAITLGFKGQQTSFIAANAITPKKVRQLAAVGTQGIATLDFLTQELRVDDGAGTTIPREPWEEPLLRELRHFLVCITGEADPLVTAKDGLHNVRIAEAAVASSETGAPIYLDW